MQVIVCSNGGIGVGKLHLTCSDRCVLCYSRLNGLVTGVSGVVKGCLVRPLQDRFTPSPSHQADLNANPLTLTNFEPK